MTRLSPPARAERAAILAVAAALHLGMLALLMTVGTLSPTPSPPLAATTIVSITPEPASGRPPPPALPSRIAETQRIYQDLMFSDQPDASATGAAGSCATLVAVTQALASDPAAVAAAHRTPPEDRSIADAVVLWNAGWSVGSSTPEAPLAPARTVVEQSLRVLPDACLDEQMAGPRLVPIADGDRTMFIAIGSGNWSWRQLLDDPGMTAPTALLSTERTPTSPWSWF